MKHEGRPAEDRRVDERRRDPEIFGQVEARGAALRGRAQQAVDIAQLEAAIIERPLDALRHQVDGTHLRGDRAEIGLGDADDRGASRAAAAVHHAAAPPERRPGRAARRRLGDGREA